VTKKVKRKKQHTEPSRVIWIGAAIGLLLLVASGIVLWNGLRKAPTVLLQVMGAPRLVVDQTTIDEGDVKLDKSIPNPSCDLEKMRIVN
jgi:flagellar basal body-associated protein FliL